MKRSHLLAPLVLIACLAILAGTAWSVRAAGPARPADPPVFGPNVIANSDSTGFGQHEPSLAVSRVHTNTVVVAQKDYRDSNVKHVWLETSTDGGVTWPANRQLQMPGVAAQYPIQSDPVVMARNDGRIYVACLATNNSTSNGAVYITWTDDDGATWRNPSVLISPADPFLDDKDWFAVDNTPGSLYYHRMYMMYAPGAGYVAEQHSTDGGLSWTPRQTIGASGTEYTYPVIGSDGTVYNFMMLNWGANQTGTIQLTKSTNGGVTWSPASTVTTAQQPASPIRGGDQFRFFAILSAAVDPNTGALYVAWTDNRNFATNGTDVVYVKSTNGGTTWSAVTRLSHDPTGIARDHITPMVTVGADSRLHAFWLDRRLDPANRLFDSWYSSSTDGGATWDPDARVSTAAQDLNIGLPPGSGGAAGDYWGLDTTQDVVYVAWNDARDNVQQDIYVARGVFGGTGATPTATSSATTPTATLPPPSATAPLPSATSTPVVPTATATATSRPPTGTIVPPTVSVVPPTVTAAPPSATAVPPTATAPATSPTGTTTPCPITFTDVQPTDYFYEPVRYLYCHGVVSGYADNTFRPYNNTTRAQMVKIVVLGFGYPIQTPATPTFSDVPSGHPFYAYIETAAAGNIVSGYADGTFRPQNNVTRGQLSKIDVIAAGWTLLNPAQPNFADVAPGTAFYEYVETAYCRAIISGYSCGGPGEPCDNGNHPYFRQNNDATRGQIAKIVYLSIGNPPCQVSSGP